MKSATLIQPHTALHLNGITEAAAPFLCENIIRKHPAPVYIIFVHDLKTAEQWSEDIELFNQLIGDEITLSIKVLPALPENVDELKLTELEFDRFATLTSLNEFYDAPLNDIRLVVITTPRSFFQPSPTRETLALSEIHLSVGKFCHFQELADKLGRELQYDCEVLCESPGQYAIRGGIIDVYPINATEPYRIDFFGDEIDEIRIYNPTTQRSAKKIEEITIAALSLNNTPYRERHIFDYLGDQVNWIFWEPSNLHQEFPSLFSYPERMPSSLPTFQDLFERRDPFLDRWFALTDLDTEDPIFGSDCIRMIDSSQPLSNHRTFSLEGQLGLDRVESEEVARQDFLKQVLEWQMEDYTIYVIAKTEGEEKRLQEILSQSDQLSELKPHYLRGVLHQGFIFNFSSDHKATKWENIKSRRGIVVVTDSEIFGRYRRRIAGNRKRQLPVKAQVDQLLDFSELAEGDNLVHLQHGICIYRGVTHMDLGNKKEEVISLEFDDGIILHLPLHESHLLTRYVGLSKIQPTLGRLGTNRWEKARHAAERATLDFAAELLSLQAQRSLDKGHAFAPDTEWQQAFEDSFIHEETRISSLPLKP